MACACLPLSGVLPPCWVRAQGSGGFTGGDFRFIDADGDEVVEYETDPTNPDTDEGGVSDGDEIAQGTDPNNPSDDIPEDDVPIASGGKVDAGCAGDTTGAPVGLWALLVGVLLPLVRRR